MIAVRGAACRGSRDSAVCRDRVAAIARRFSRGTAIARSPRRRRDVGVAHATRFFARADNFLDTR